MNRGMEPLLQRTSLILDIHVEVNWHLVKQCIQWPVSRNHIPGSGLEIIKVTCLFVFWSWTGPSTGFILMAIFRNFTSKLYSSLARNRVYDISQQDQDIVSDDIKQQIHCHWQKKGISASLAPSRNIANFRPFWRAWKLLPPFSFLAQ